MFSIFKKKKEKVTIKGVLENYSHCKAINLYPHKMNGVEETVWLNPHNQQCFNYGNFTVDDFIDWSNGTGKIVKGDTQEEKDKVMYYAKLMNKLDYRLFMYHRYFKLIENGKLGKVEFIVGYLNRNIKKPFRKNDLKNIYLNLAVDVQRDLQHLTKFEFQNNYDYYKASLKNRLYDSQREVRGSLRTLYLVGSGFYGACNTPERLNNLSWAVDLIIAYGYYLHLKEDIKLKMPDFEYVDSIRFK